MFLNIVIYSQLFFQVFCHTPKNHSDIIVTYSGHAEAGIRRPILHMKNNVTTVPAKIQLNDKPTEPAEGVIFIPNEREAPRDVNQARRAPLSEVMYRRTLNDAVGRRNAVETGVKTLIIRETLKPDIVFISGKNKENVEYPIKKKTDEKRRRTNPEEKVTVEPMTCHNLNCNNTVNPVCGMKLDQNTHKYRLFLNNCFFRKVNCAFTYNFNRYKMVPFEKCQNVGGHYSERPYVYKARPLQAEPSPPVPDRRAFSSRRAMSQSTDGSFCAHACPTTCPDNYEPECAISSTGQQRVFMNHCKLDYNSCFFGIVWHRRPLSDCVGGEKASMQQNRGFIGWMQRAGIVDGRGRFKIA